MGTVMGPISRVAEFKQIETTLGARDLQQLRWPPTNIADTPQDARARLFMLPNAHYDDPEFSWRFAVAPAAIGFMDGRGIGPQYSGDLFVGASVPALDAGYLFHFNLTGNRRKIGVDDRRLEDRVADNVAKFDPTESESLRFGRLRWNRYPDQPSGTLYVVAVPTRKSNSTSQDTRRRNLKAMRGVEPSADADVVAHVVRARW